MDFESLKSQVSNLTLYDLKAGVRKVQNAVMNLTEMESKVREATNADPWGAPSSLMMEIAQGTHNYQQLNEIMPMIYKRFTDKTAEEWRQIYKSLQLLEFLVKNGSERVVDDARQHLSLLRMLRQFHYIDMNGKDQGINVRNRSVELAKLLGDVDQIRQERKKARANKNKYGGVEGGAGLGFSSGSSGRYGGFGSESAGPADYGGYSGEVYGDGGGFGGRDTDFSGTQRRGEQFEEYDEADEVSSPARGTTRVSTASTTKKEKAPPKAKEPEKDLFDFGDEEPVTKAPTTSYNIASATNTLAVDEDDDFDDFQSADPPSAATSKAPAAVFAPPQSTSSTTMLTAPPVTSKPTQTPGSANYSNFYSAAAPSATPTTSISNTSAQPQMRAPAAQPYKPSGPNYYTSVPAAMNTSSNGAAAISSTASKATTSQPSYTSSTSASQLGKPIPKPAASSGGDAFGSLWSSASTKAGVQNKSQTSKGPDLASMAKAKSEAGIWGTTNSSSLGSTTASNTPVQTQSRPAAPLGNGLDDLLG